MEDFWVRCFAFISYGYYAKAVLFAIIRISTEKFILHLIINC